MNLTIYDKTTLSPKKNSSDAYIEDVYDFDYNGTHLGERKITASIKSPVKIDFEIGDYVEYEDETFKIQTVPVGRRVYSSEMIEYTIIFYWAGYELGLVTFLDVLLEGDDSAAYYSQTADVYIEANVQVLANRILANLNRIYTGTDAWSILVNTAAGSPVDLTQYKTVVAENLTCADVLQFINSMFGLDYKFGKDKTIYIGYDPDVSYLFEYGKDKGICEINRVQSDQKVITRVIAFGSTRNINPSYRSSDGVSYHPRLMLPDPGYVDSAKISEYGIREAIYINEEIYPTIGNPAVFSVDTILDAPTDDTPQYTTNVITPAYFKTVTDPSNPLIKGYFVPAVTEQVLIPKGDYSTFTIYIEDLGFDINDENIKSTTEAKMSFTSGYMEGVEFKIISYTKLMTNVSGVPTWDDGFGNQLYKVILERNSDDPNHVIPSSVVPVQAGDTFKLLDIYLPATYESAAEDALLDDATSWLALHDKSPEGYAIKFAEEYIARNPSAKPYLKESNAVLISDSLLDLVESAVLIQGITISYKSENILPTYDLTVSDTPIKSYTKKIQDELDQSNQSVSEVNAVTQSQIQNIVKSASIFKSSIVNNNMELKGARIESQSVQNVSLSPDIRSTRIILQAYLQVNYGGDANQAYGSSGVMIHKDTDIVWGGIQDLEHQTWTIAAPQIFTLETTKSYWVYIKANVDDGTAVWYLSETKLYITEVEGYYLFEWGNIIPVRDGIRYYQNEYGVNQVSAYVYIAYASAADGSTGFTLTNDPALEYMAILSSPAEIESPVVGDFDGLWFKRKGDTPVGGGTVTSVGSGAGMDFTDFSDSGDVILGTPSTVDGTTINEVTGTSHTHKLGNVPIENVIQGSPVEYGALYNLYALIDARKITSSDDWYVPLQSHYQDMETNLGGASVAGGKLKEAGTTHWNDPNTGATNEIGFTAVGSGVRIEDGTFLNDGNPSLKVFCELWTFTDDTPGLTKMTFNLYYADAGSNSTGSQWGYNAGCAVRFVRDCTTEELSLPDGLITAKYKGNNGIEYPCTKSGSYIYTARNINETKYRDGSWIHGYDGGVYTPIADVDWAALTTEAMCYYDDNEAYGGGETPLDYFLHKPVTIAPESASVASIDANQVLTINALAKSEIPYDIDFGFSDFTLGTAKVYTLDLKAKKAYTIGGVVLRCDTGTLTGVAIKINGTAVTSLSSVTIDNTITETSATGANSVAIGDLVTLEISTGYTGTPTVFDGKLLRTLT